jgi:hypothetical protein
MRKDPCIAGCKYLVVGRETLPTYSDQCELYGTTLNRMLVPDPYDKGVISVCCKCVDCMEKELSCSIDEKVREVYSFYRSFVQEMDAQFSELELLIIKRESIYQNKGDVC